MNNQTNILALIPMARKAEAWTHEQIPTVKGPGALQALQGLAVFAAEASPMDDIPEDREQFFIAERPNGDRFLVNTEGYNYCRYVARIPADAPTALLEGRGADLAGACEGEQVADLIDLAAALIGIDFSTPSDVELAIQLRERARKLIAEIEARAKG